MNVRYFGLSLNEAARPNAGQDPRRGVYDVERPIQQSCSTQHVQPRDGRRSMDLPTPRQLTLSFLFPFVVREGRLPSRTLLAWCCGNDLDLLLFGFLGLPIASLLAFGHVDLPGFEEKANPNAELVTLSLLSVHACSQCGFTRARAAFRSCR